MQSFALLPKSTALVLIDLQKGITSFSVEPRSSAEVIVNATNLAKRFRDLGTPVFLVRVAFPSGEAALKLVTDAQPPLPASEPEGWLEFAIEPQPQDVLILKRHWGAFYGTELDLQLRRRHIETVVLGGIATNFGVESTARNAYEFGYHLVFAEDAMGAFTRVNHEFAIQNNFPRLGRVRSTQEILQALDGGK
jgi:nicotinamidase-related amidase